MIEAPGGLVFGLFEPEYDSFLVWLSDASRYIEEVNTQLGYYRESLSAGESNE